MSAYSQILRKIRWLGGIILVLANTAFGQPSGDTVVDSWISPYAFKAGNNDSMSELDPAFYTTGLEMCNDPAALTWESICPTSLSFTPSSYTGGYQAFGVGVTNYPEGAYIIPICYWVFYEDINGDIYNIVPYCDFYGVSWPNQLLGTVAARLKFGQDLVTTSYGNVPMSTVAFKANYLYTPYNPSYQCDPDINVSGLSAPCDTSDSNVFAVPEAGYEDKVLIEDLGCSPRFGVRVNGTWDAEDGCFTYDSYFYSDMPGAYQDSPIYDSADYFVPASGTTTASMISEGSTYTWLADFWQFGLESSSSHNIQHNSAVTTWYLSNCGTNCYFNVKQRRIAPVVTLP